MKAEVKKVAKKVTKKVAKKVAKKVTKKVAKKKIVDCGVKPVLSKEQKNAVKKMKKLSSFCEKNDIKMLSAMSVEGMLVIQDFNVKNHVERLGLERFIEGAL